mmetsp:Transcript_43440/g.123092  ORF Transcript_43440/g.123092 Transcript_43440/m.123092 type:complete len:99 (-) Transcript_43440:177-473(-)
MAKQPASRKPAVPMWRVGDAMPTFREIHWSRDDHKSKRELHQFYELYYYAHDKHEIGVGSYPRIPEAKTDYETIKACSYRNVRVVRKEQPMFQTCTCH